MKGNSNNLNDKTKVRKKLLQQYMEFHKLDAILITSPTNVYYFTNFYSDPHERFMAYFFDKAGMEILFVPLLDQQAAEEAASIDQVIGIADGQNPYVVLSQAVGKLQAIGIEKGYMTVSRYEQIVDVLQQPKTIDIEEAILSLRMKKSEDEITKVQHAIHIVEKVVDHAASLAVIGMSEQELMAELEYQMRKLGAERPAFESIVLTGTRTALPHGKPGLAKLEAGHFLLIDIGVQAAGYCSDITRTFVMGEASSDQEKIYQTVLAANEAGIAASQAGVTFGSIDQAAREVIQSAGYGQWFTHRLGHGFGMEVHEQPSVSTGNDTIVEAGMLYTVEPGIYIPSIGGVRIEDDVYITPNGKAKALTSYPKQLITLG